MFKINRKHLDRLINLKLFHFRLTIQLLHMLPKSQIF